ncbi:hypothetical protein DIE16_15290 [Burkholderia sp. Bp9090]|nr:hypothetical protein DIE09_24605 [Burkholderia sp. Bp9010]RQS04247.1 hypothetical protein DIE02_18345 [Burkholderia sp. Bp8991]RQS36592.1 hypothetical protein DIE01_24515 [Burkholderia sp. Bp8990]RQS54543.1 hypothetical protein DID99_15795 [Burkholderia sp. Bp8986]RQS71808.1 hypothetical protein DID97_21005 [Burkholderia sp. Bp8977]RQZ38442.1 hypothetical protein DIE16_15290 [Burkholderia sp. Bp9090]
MGFAIRDIRAGGPRREAIMKIAIAGGSIAGLAAAVTLNCIGREAAVHERRDRPSPAQGGAVAVLRRLTTFPDTHGEPLRGHLAAPGRPPARSRRPGSPPPASTCAPAAAGLAVTGMRFAADPCRGGRA